MSSGTGEFQKGETVPQIKEEIENLKSQVASSFAIPVDRIVPLRLPAHLKQPRLYFDPRKMELLQESIAKHGVLEPILLRHSQNSTFELISGERRWRCCVALGIETIPSVVRQMSDSAALEAALIAHLLNEEISPIEETESILGLISLRLNLSLEDVKASLYQVKNSYARDLETSRTLSNQQLEIIHTILQEFGLKLSSFVSNRLPMLNLSSDLLTLVQDGKLSPTNAVLINRQPQEFHPFLISQAEGLTKKDLLDLIKGTVNQNHKEDKRTTLSEQIYKRIKGIKGKTGLMGRPEVISRLNKIDHLLEEIEAMRE